jgi:hypothetical protein
MQGNTVLASTLCLCLQRQGPHFLLCSPHPSMHCCTLQWILLVQLDDPFSRSPANVDDGYRCGGSMADVSRQCRQQVMLSN